VLLRHDRNSPSRTRPKGSREGLLQTIKSETSSFEKDLTNKAEAETAMVKASLDGEQVVDVRKKTVASTTGEEGSPGILAERHKEGRRIDAQRDLEVAEDRMQIARSMRAAQISARPTPDVNRLKARRSEGTPQNAGRCAWDSPQAYNTYIFAKTALRRRS